MLELVVRAVGLFLVAFGLVGAVLPRATAGAGEILDARYSRSDPSEIEPAEWNVRLTRLVGIATILYGLFLVVGGQPW